MKIIISNILLSSSLLLLSNTSAIALKLKNTKQELAIKKTEKKNIKVETYSWGPSDNWASIRNVKRYWKRDKYTYYIDFNDLLGNITNVTNLVVDYSFETNSTYVNGYGKITNKNILNKIANIIKIKSKIDFWFDAWGKGLWAKAAIGSDILYWTTSDESNRVFGKFYQDNFKINIVFNYEYEWAKALKNK